MERYDAIVIGVGGVGSAALAHLATRGAKVLGIERFESPNKLGSTHGQTRLIRMAYYEHPDYVPLLQRAYQLWGGLEQESGRTLYHGCGILQVSPGDGSVYPGVLASAAQHQLQVETLSEEEVRRRFPGFRIEEPLRAVFEPGAGYLMVEDGVTSYVEQAKRAGGTLLNGESVREWRAVGGGVEVVTDRNQYSAKNLIVTAGSWANDFLRDLGVRLEVVRKSLYWYEAEEDVYRPESGGVGFIYETSRGNFYGFPQIDGNGVKVAEHTGGHPVTDALQVNRDEDPAETVRVLDFLSRYLPGVSPRKKAFATCLYTLSPDRRFIVDRHPEFPQVSFAAGLSGHGYKFASVLGEVLADWASEGRTDLPVGFLGLGRPGLCG